MLGPGCLHATAGRPTSGRAAGAAPQAAQAAGEVASAARAATDWYGDESASAAPSTAERAGCATAAPGCQAAMRGALPRGAALLVAACGGRSSFSMPPAVAAWTPGHGAEARSTQRYGGVVRWGGHTVTHSDTPGPTNKGRHAIAVCSQQHCPHCRQRRRIFFAWRAAGCSRPAGRIGERRARGGHRCSTKPSPRWHHSDTMIMSVGETHSVGGPIEIESQIEHRARNVGSDAGKWHRTSGLGEW